MKRVLPLAVIVVAAALSGGVGRSKATFVAHSDQAAAAFAASAAFNGVSIALGDPGTPLRSTVPLSATASSDRTLVSVTYQRSPAGAGTWTTICAPTAAPGDCTWDTTAVADGLYDPARRRARRLRLHTQRRHRLAPRRQHRPRHHGHRRHAADRHGGRLRDRDRRRQRRDLGRARGAPLRRWR